MTDLITRDPNDTGEIPTLVGETTHRITAEQRARLVGEATQNLAGWDANLPPYRRPAALEIDDTVTYIRIPETIGVVPDLADAQPIAPFERVIDTERLTLLGSLAGAEADITGELTTPPTTPPPLPPQPPANPPSKSWPGRVLYRPKHRQSSPLWGLAQLAGILLAAGAILWVIS